MTYLLLKAVISGIIVALVSEIARRSPGLGALIASLPLVSILAMIWLWRDTGDAERIAAHSSATFWLVLPTLPMFLALPALLKRGVGFPFALTAVCIGTVILYVVFAAMLRRFGISI